MYQPIPYLQLLRVRELIRQADPACKEWWALLWKERLLDGWCREHMGADYLRLTASPQSAVSLLPEPL